MKTVGNDIYKLIPPVSRFGGKRAAKEQGIIEKLKSSFEKYFGIGEPVSFNRIDKEE